MAVLSVNGPKRLATMLVGAAATLLLALALPASAADTTPAPDAAAADQTVATVNGTPIRMSDLAVAAQEFADQLKRIPPDKQRAALIDVVIDIRLLARAAEAEGIDKQPDVAGRLAFARDQALRGEYLHAKVFSSITDAAVKKRYDEETAKFVPGDEIHVRHILVKTEDEAKAVIADLDKGGDFAKIEIVPDPAAPPATPPADATTPATPPADSTTPAAPATPPADATAPAAPAAPAQ